jgi:hypothetical protein
MRTADTGIPEVVSDDDAFGVVSTFNAARRVN